MSKGVLVIDKKEVPTIQVGVTNRVRTVTDTDHFVIPAQGECVCIEKREYDDFFPLRRNTSFNQQNTSKQSSHYRWPLHW